MSAVTTLAPVSFLELEITGRCQLACTHCYAESGPGGSHGSMTVADWERVITEARDLGVEAVQFIGGEPTLYPGLGRLIRYALQQRVAGRCLLEPRARHAGALGAVPAARRFPRHVLVLELIPLRTRRSPGPWAATGGRRRTSLRRCGGESRSGPGSWRSLMGRTSTVPVLACWSWG